MSIQSSERRGSVHEAPEVVAFKVIDDKWVEVTLDFNGEQMTYFVVRRRKPASPPARGRDKSRWAALWA